VHAPRESQLAVGPNGSLVDATATLRDGELVELVLVNLSTKRAKGRVLINAVRRQVSGAELYRADVTAESLDDMVPACERLALSLQRQVPIGQTVNRHNVTLAEARSTRRPNRLGSESIFGVKVGFALPVAAFTQVNPLGSLEFNVRLEREHFFFELGAGALIPAVVSSNSPVYGGITFELGASYFLSEGDTAPYLGAGVQPRLIFAGSVLNLAPYVQAGLMFSRQSSPRVYAQLRVSQNVLPVGDNLYPTELAAQVGIGW
jgi:hypothetical protein